MSSPPPQHRDRVFFDSLTRPARSTSQMCLHKILRIITTLPLPTTAISPLSLTSETRDSCGEDNAPGGSKASEFRNLPELEESIEPDGSGLSSASTTAAEFNKTGGVRLGKEVAEIDDGENNSMIMLIEAAMLIFGEFKDDDKSEARKENICIELNKDDAAAEMGGEFQEPPSPPVVRSKRGRTRVLPYKYRDSVLEPLTRLSRNRSSVLPTKRRRR